MHRPILKMWIYHWAPFACNGVEMMRWTTLSKLRQGHGTKKNRNWGEWLVWTCHITLQKRRIWYMLAMALNFLHLDSTGLCKDSIFIIWRGGTKTKRMTIIYYNNWNRKFLCQLQ